MTALPGNSVPRNWVSAKIGELFTVFGGGTPDTQKSEYWKGNFPWISSADIDERHRITPRRAISRDAIENSATNLVPKGSVIIVTRVGLGKAALADRDLCFSQDSQALLFDPAIFDPHFVLYQMSQTVGIFRHVSRGTTISGVTKKQLLELDFKLPPTAEQRKIVAEIEKQFTRLDAAIVALKRVQANLKRYRASVLKAACEGRLVPTEAELARREGRSYESASELLKRILADRRSRWEAAQLAKFRASGKLPKDNRWKLDYEVSAEPENTQPIGLPEGWTWATVGQLAALEPNSITDGPFGSNLKTEHYTAVGPRVIRLQNIGDGAFVDAKAHISAEHYEKLTKHRVYAGDIVIAGLGERPPRSCVIPSSVGPAIVKADCIRFKPAPQVAVSRFLNLALNAEPTKARMAEIVHGVGRPRLNLGEIKAIVVPLPPTEEQCRIVSEADRHLSIIDETETQFEDDLRRAERLRQAILKRAFEGKLVPQDPNDEPANVLLERTRAARESIDERKSSKPAPARRKSARSARVSHG
jgi:type I restriction enzyme S subunit